jgi:hypothetical protein
MLDELGGELLFGRKVDVAMWDVATAHDRVVDLIYEIPDPERVVQGSAQPAARSSLTSLPLAFLSDFSAEVFSAARPVRPDEHIVALGMDTGGKTHRATTEVDGTDHPFDHSAR